jgi:hypothetical protein
MNQDESAARFEHADACLLSGRLDEAETLYQSLLSAALSGETGRQQKTRAYERLVHLQVRKNRFDEGVRVFEEYLRSDCAERCDREFDSLYCEGLRATRTSPAPLKRRERYYALANLLQSTPREQGLVAECGCFRGLSSFVLCSSIKLAGGAFDGAGYRIFDSFEGLSDPQPEDVVPAADPNALALRETNRRGRFAVSLEDVRAGLRAFPGIEYFPGWIPLAFPIEPGARYRFVHLDVDLYHPTRDSLAYFYPRLATGGRIVCDDYGWPGARRAIQEFCTRENIRYSVTPYNQAYLTRESGADAKSRPGA